MTSARLGVALVALLLLATAATAQSPVWTKITLTELDCAGCAKKVGTKLGTVSGVAEVRYDLKTRMMYVAHKANATPSPRGLWEAIEQADHAVQSLETPTATYTSKPGS